MIIQINKTVYQSLSESERCVIDFINQNETKIPLLSITSIAEKTFTSPATVTRAIQKCGFQGITELRYKLSQGTRANSPLRLLMLSTRFWTRLSANARKPLTI